MYKFTCAHCKVTNLSGTFQKDAGDWIIICNHCRAKNVVAVTIIGDVAVPTPTVEVEGWR